jgi:alpha-galactosidase
MNLKLTTACAGIAVFSLFGSVDVCAEIVNITTGSTSLVLKADKGKELRFYHYGDKLSDEDIKSMTESSAPWVSAYAAYGINTRRETAVAATHVDGNMTLDLVVDGVERKGNVITVKLKDTYYPFYVSLNYRTYPDNDIIEMWSEISHGEKGTVTLTEYASGYLALPYGDVWSSNLYGEWAKEGWLEELPVPHGLKVVKNRDGLRPNHAAHGEMMLSLDGKPQERSGRVIGAALCYPGNFKLRTLNDNSNWIHFFAGINEEHAPYYLEKGETFTTPTLAVTYSGNGMGQVSRNFHRWGRDNKLAHGNQLRDVLLNSWEGVYFKIKEDEMHQMMADIASLGGELFVMDDGWFGDKYPRNNDTQGLGDWVVDTTKLPNGIGGLTSAAKKAGVKFGIWIEPEMLDIKSELYEKHPDYIIKATHRDNVPGRGKAQIALDLANPKCQDIVFTIVDTLLTKYPDIAYIKWDANNALPIHGSQYLAANRQSHNNIAYWRGLTATLDRIRAKHPDVVMQACSSGGGRVNYGYLPWFDEFWTSDNTDALQRVYIQWGTSYFFPAVGMGSHISAAPNHQTRRHTSLKYRTDVAMAGRLGLELQPKNMSDKEKEQTTRAIADYKNIRPIVQLGDLYRLQSPFEKKGVASLMYVTPDKSRAAFFWWKTESMAAEQLHRIPMDGLDPDKTYRVTELNRVDKKPLSYEGKTFTGRALMANGLPMPAFHSLDKADATDFSSRVLLLEAL